MKRTALLSILVLLLCAPCLLAGCGLFDAFSSNVPTTYPDADQYTAGNTEFEGKVDMLRVFWHFGSVTVRTHGEDTVKIEEVADREVDDTLRLHWRYFHASEYGNVLNIYYSASGDFDFGDLRKDIVVYLPENDGMDIDLTVDSAAVDVDLSQFENTLEELSVITNSGRISARIDSAATVRIAGQNDEGVPEEDREFFLRADGRVYDLGISTSYARVDVAAEYVYKGEVGTVYGDLLFEADEVKSMTLHNSRNRIDATVRQFETLDIEACYEPCVLKLSPDASFTLTLKEKDRFRSKMSPKQVTVDFDGVSGDRPRYTVGAGESSISVATDSDLTVLPLDGSE